MDKTKAAPNKASPNISCWNIMPSLFDPLTDPANGHGSRRKPQVMKVYPETLLLCFSEQS